MIAAIVLAAGKSTRMGKFKMTLPWKQTTVIGNVVQTLSDAGLTEINLVVGYKQDSIKEVLSSFSVRYLVNSEYANGEMISSVQTGLRGLSKDADAALIVLGDQPQLESQVIKAIMDSYAASKCNIVIPSYQMSRGHPWIIAKPLWSEIYSIKPPRTLRDFINKNQDKISYVEVNTASVIQDIDTPEEYELYEGRKNTSNKRT